jgi:hypothetical protein
MSEKKITNDPANYRKVSEPHETPKAANEALTAFYEEVGELRKKHRIAQVLVVCETNVMYESGEGAALTHMQYGDALKGVPLAAYAYGQLKSEQLEMINTLLAGEGIKRSPKK